MTTRVRPRHLLPLLFIVAFLALPAHPGERTSAEQMDFGVRAAKKGLWREALFRWERALELAPGNPRLLNNLAIAYETTGDFTKAEQMYQEALRLAPDNRDIRQNHDLFNAYYKELLARREHQQRREPPPPPPESPEEPEEKPDDAPPR